MKARWPALGVAAAVGAHGNVATAQVRWDADLAEGAERRVLTSRPAGGADAGFGPAMEASTHLVLVPLVRVGVYVQCDSSPVSAQESRELFSGGVDLRIVSPWPRGDLRGYARVGVGEVGTFASAHGLTDTGASAGGRFVAGANGRFTEVPIAFGLLSRVATPLWVTAEVGARLGFAFAGPAYLPATGHDGGGSVTSGNDTFAVFADVGVMWGR